MAEYHLTTPISEDDARKLKIGDIVYVTGEHVYTARDEAHERALEMYEKGEKTPVDFEGSVVYHVGPLAWQKDTNSCWKRWNGPKDLERSERSRSSLHQLHWRLWCSCG